MYLGCIVRQRKDGEKGQGFDRESGVKKPNEKKLIAANREF